MRPRILPYNKPVGSWAVQLMTIIGGRDARHAAYAPAQWATMRCSLRSVTSKGKLSAPELLFFHPELMFRVLEFVSDGSAVWQSTWGSGSSWAQEHVQLSRVTSNIALAVWLHVFIFPKATIGGKNIGRSWMTEVLPSVWDLRDLLILLVHVP